jgi:prepilin-type N-terminal cleavage/methylation domain-containing protein
MPVRKNKQSGFTLVEMSIVLVIIGLIVAGVLVGQDLIKNAQVRSTVQQIESYNAAVNAFNGKYNCMPGDCVKGTTFIAGLSTYAGTTITPNGNGRLDDVVGTPIVGNVTAGFVQELEIFWEHLAKADMVNGQFVAVGATGPSVINTHFPSTKLKKGGIVAVSEGGDNYWLVGVRPDATGLIVGGVTWIAANNGAMQPVEAYGIDVKLDDGLASSGLTQAVTAIGTGANGMTTPTWSGSATAYVAGTTTAALTSCWTGTPSATANVDYQLTLESNLCVIRVRMQG